LLALLLLLLIAWLLIQTTPVQNWLVGQFTSRISKDLKTKVTIQHVDFSLFNKASLEGVYIEDHQKDTLLYAGKIKLNITDWFFFKDKAAIKYIALEHAVINMNRTDSVWNYQFIVDEYFSGPSSGKKKKGIEFDLKKVDLTKVSFVEKDGWRGKDSYISVGELKLEAEQINFNTKIVRVKTISITSPSYTELSYTGRRPAPSITPLPATVNDSLPANSSDWNIVIDHIVMKDGLVKIERSTPKRAMLPYYAHCNCCPQGYNRKKRL
jgi:hypothetical protein